MKTNTNFQSVKNTILANPTFGLKTKKNQFVIAFRTCSGPIFRFIVSDEMINDLVKYIIKCPVLSNVSLSEPLPNQAIIKVYESLKYSTSKIISKLIK